MAKLPKNFELNKYDYEKYEWYNPVFVLQCYNDLLKRYPGNSEHSLFKEAKEAAVAAMSLLGARKLHADNTYVMQMNRQSQRPDVIAATRRINVDDGKPIIKISPLEITEMESHVDHNDIAKFLLEKKLLKDYPHEVIFICVINKILQFDPFNVAKRITISGKKNAVYILGMKGASPSFMLNIASLQPVVAATDFVLADQAINYPEKHRIFLIEDEQNLNPALTQIKVAPINLFDFFKLDGKTIEKVFGPLGS